MAWRINGCRGLLVVLLLIHSDRFQKPDHIIQSIKARHILLISDSCFSASLLVRGISSDMGGAFKDWEKNPSRWAFISGKGVVSDGKEGENSPFAAGIIKNLRENDEEVINIIKLTK